MTPPKLLMKTVSVVEVNDEDEASVGAAAPATYQTYLRCVKIYLRWIKKDIWDLSNIFEMHQNKIFEITISTRF